MHYTLDMDMLTEAEIVMLFRQKLS
jgi:hypothetical protein